MEYGCECPSLLESRTEIYTEIQRWVRDDTSTWTRTYLLSKDLLSCYGCCVFKNLLSFFVSHKL